MTPGAKEIVAAIRPKPAAEPVIRRKPVCLESRERRSDSAKPAQPERPVSPGVSESPKPAGSVEVARPEVYNFRFLAPSRRHWERRRPACVLLGTFRARCASVFWSVRAISVSTGDRAVCGARPGLGSRSTISNRWGKEGRAARRTFGFSVGGTIFSPRRGSSGRSS